MIEDNYLKDELYNLIKQDSSVFDFIQAGSLDGIWYWDLENPENEWMSNRFWETFGIDPSTKKHLASEWQEIIFEDDLKTATENFNKHLENPNYPYDHIVRYYHQDGNTVWIRCRGIAIRDENHKPVKMLGVHINLSSIYSQFHDLIESQGAQFETLFNNAQIGLIYINDDRELIKANPRLAKMLGYESPNEMVGLSMKSLHLSEENFISFGKKYFESLRNGVNLNIEYQVRCKDNSPLWVSLSGKALDNNIPANLSKGILWSLQDISDRKMIEEKLLKSNERWQAALNANDDGVWEWDLQANKLYTSERWNAIHGYKAEDTIKLEDWQNNIHPDDLTRIEATLHEVLTDPSISSFSSEYRFRSVEGSYRWILDRGIILERSDAGKPLRIIGTHHNISQRKQFENALIQERNRSNHYLDIIGEMIIILDTLGTISMINQEGCRLLEARESDIIGKNWFDTFLLVDNYTEVKGYFSQLMAGNLDNLEYVENSIKTIKSNKRLIAWHNSLVYDESGKIIGLLSSGRDITEKRELEIKLEEERLRFELAVEGTNDGLWDWNTITNEAYFSKQFVAMFGYDAKELPNTIDAWKELLHPDDKESAYEAVETYFNSQGTHAYQNIFRMRSKDGSWKWIKGRGKALFDSDGRPVRFIGFNTDITQEIQLQNKIKESQQRFHDIFDAVPVGIFYFTTDMIIKELNPAFANILGTIPEKLVDFNMRERLNNSRMLESIRKCLSEGEASFHGTYISVSSAKASFIDVAYRAIYDEEGNIKGGIGIVQDLTLQKSLEDEVTKKETLHKQLFTNKKVPTLFIDPLNGSIIDANKAAADFYGYTVDELTKMSISQINTMDPETIKTEMDNALNERRDYFLFQHRLQSGDIRDVEVYSGPITYGEKEILYSIVHDVSDKQKLELELHEQHKHLQNVINGMHDAMTVIDKDYNVLLMNEAAKEMLKEELIEDIEHPKCYEVSHHSKLPCESENHPCPLKKSIQSGTTQKALHRHLTASDEERLVEVTISPLKNSAGETYAFVESGHDVTDLLEMKKELHRQINFDNLTGLPSRTLFMDRLQEFIIHAKRNKTKAAVIIINIDHFKIINESFGHQAGDLVIKTFAEWIQGVLRNEDTLARLSGDSYAILLEDIVDDLIAVRILESLKTIVDESYIEVVDQEVHLSYSAGIAIYPEDGKTTENIFKNADAALYEAKEGGRNTYRYYTDELTERAFHRVVMDTNLRDAIKNEEFVLYYQPQYDSRSNTLIGMEALIRWNHHSMGLVSPGKFIHILETSSLIIPVGIWIMKTAFKQALIWRQNGYDPGILSVNLSMVQLASGKELVEQIMQLLDTTGCNPKWIGLEVTESLMMNNPDKTIGLLRELHELGFLISMDDFGTGYSSLSYLKQMPISKLKIDKSFIDGLPDDEDDISMARSVIGLAKNMKLEVIAEGVEKEEQKNFLLENGCHEIQGYLYAKPMDVEKMTALLKEHNEMQLEK